MLEPQAREHRRVLSLWQLIERAEPAMPRVRAWIGAAKNAVELLPQSPGAGDRTLVALQITTRSPMGAIAHETGGLLVDHGWIRILGAHGPRSARDLATWNGLLPPDAQPRVSGALLIGDDAVGGFFALDGGAFGGSRHDVHYLAPDTLEWEPMEIGYSAWLRWAFDGDLDGFYGAQRWSGWKTDVAALSANDAFSFFPPLWMKPDGGRRDRRGVPVDQLWDVALDFRRQLGLV